MPRRVHRSQDIAVGCAMSGLLETLTRPWTLHIIWLLSTHGPMRFGALRRTAEGISARVLAVRLRMLEEKGFVTRTVKPSNPPEVTYSPTQRLKEMEGVMEHLTQLSIQWQSEDVQKAVAA
ncbi:MAG TPA: helix-turn-helix domain-containing protein [Acidobacteriaceae bacterium]